MSKGDDMTSAAAIVAGILNLSEAEFYQADTNALAARELILLEMDFLGVAVNAPAVIATDRCDRLPLLLAARFSGERDWDLPLRDHCLLVGTNLQDGSVHLAPALALEKELASRHGRQKSPRGARPEGLAAEAAQLTELAARDRLFIRWNTGLWSLGVIWYDWPSNTVVVSLQGDEPARSAPARTVDPQPPPPRDGEEAGGPALPCYVPVPRTPAMPESGAAFTIEPRTAAGRQQLLVYGAFVVPAREFELPSEETVHKLPDGRREPLAAVVPATLVVLSPDGDPPRRFDWAVPVYGRKLKPGEEARGCFAIDALGAVAVDALGAVPALAPGDYVCYLLMDGRIFGPQALVVPAGGK